MCRVPAGLRLSKTSAFPLAVFGVHENEVLLVLLLFVLARTVSRGWVGRGTGGVGTCGRMPGARCVPCLCHVSPHEYFWGRRW
eukprot:COSAG02_NODE_2156_length_9643_cov_55.052761_14_plen_83_part_00